MRSMKEQKNIFPPDFQWGVATSAFQLEGSPNADWTTWDPLLGKNPCITDHYKRFREDLKLLKELVTSLSLPCNTDKHDNYKFGWKTRSGKSRSTGAILFGENNIDFSLFFIEM
jgi:hypothetical protein